jgi:hypothetical protein
VHAGGMPVVVALANPSRDETRWCSAVWRCCCRGGTLIAVAGIMLGCGGAREPAAVGSFVAQCLGVDDRGDLTRAPPVVCRLDAHGEVKSVSDIDLERGLPFIVDTASERVLAISRSGDVIDVTDGEAEFVARADAMSAYGFAPKSQVVRLTRTGVLLTVDDVLLTTFELDGVVDVKSGVDVRGDEIAFTVELPSGVFTIVVGNMSSGITREVFAWSEYVGEARWSPDGNRLSLVGPDYRSIVVITADGAIVTTLASEDSRLSGRVNGPRWIDNDTVVYHDSATALLEGDVRTGQAEVTQFYNFDERPEFVPVLPVPLPG